MTIKVRATKRGYDGVLLRREGDVFTLTDDRQFSSKWMQHVPDTTTERRTTAQDTVNQLHDERFAPTRRRVPVSNDDGRAVTEFDPYRRTDG